jgi:hypothetical protein
MKKYIITLIFGCWYLIHVPNVLNIDQWGVLSEETFYQTDEQAMEALQPFTIPG